MAMPQGKQGYRRSVNGYKFGKAKLAKATAVEEVITSSLCELAANSAGIPTELLFLSPFLCQKEMGKGVGQVGPLAQAWKCPHTSKKKKITADTCHNGCGKSADKINNLEVLP